MPGRRDLRQECTTSEVDLQQTPSNSLLMLKNFLSMLDKSLKRMRMKRKECGGKITLMRRRKEFQRSLRVTNQVLINLKTLTGYVPWEEREHLKTKSAWPVALEWLTTSIITIFLRAFIYLRIYKPFYYNRNKSSYFSASYLFIYLLADTKFLYMIWYFFLSRFKWLVGGLSFQEGIFYIWLLRTGRYFWLHGGIRLGKFDTKTLLTELYYKYFTDWEKEGICSAGFLPGFFIISLVEGLTIF